MLVVKDLKKTFNKREVLRGISFELHQGEIFVVMGTSGSGKTTLMKCLSGLETPTSGEVWLHGINLLKQPGFAFQEIGYVFQNAALFDSLTIEDNILFGLRRKQRLSKSQEREIVQKYLSAVSLSGIEKLHPSQLSGGMQKRVGLARALTMTPNLVFYDEPTSGLDPLTSYSIDELIVNTRNTLGVTSIVVTHELNSAARIADRIAFLERGKILFLGDIESFYKSELPSIQHLIKYADSRILT